jgi:hypothetical protein
MKRRLGGLLLLAVLVPACKAAGPKAAPGAPTPPPEAFRSYIAELRVLRHRGDERSLTLAPAQKLGGACDVAVRVRGTSFESGTARFALDTVGSPSVGGREAKCRRLHPGIDLVLSGFAAEPAEAEVKARVDEILPTPEAYLKAKGVAFDRPADRLPAEVASQLPDATHQERALARAVSAWPKTLLSVNPWVHDPRVRHEGLVDVEAVIGADGRLYNPRVVTSLSPTHEEAVESALLFWRFEPARRGGEPVGARIPLRLVLRVD